ncbi:MAG: sigma-70 family RNA polymerase sigma factor [Clostridia bacterium]|nr:sigma-70 family RNA polymerase sigma factor [Clostridia bacterium]
MQYRDVTDETLVMLTLAGEQSAYEKLVLRYQNAVIGSALQITRNRFMAEDAAQDAFVAAWMKLNTLQQPEKFGPWVCRIVRNCAMNMVTRYRSFLPEIPLEDWDIADDPKQNPAELLAWSEEKSELERSMEKLPEKVGRIIYLHYFEGLSVAEIADRMCVSAGTVKRQLHDGRKRIRKELCAMDETYNDTLIQRVMKKVEELKLWQVKTDKTGFEAVYKDVLKEVEDLPESDSKYHALADVLLCGWWWLPGEKNDALFARIREAALQGKNDEVMEFIVTREDSQVWGNAKIEFIRDRQIPMLEKAGFIRTLAREWFWLGYQYFRDGQTENGYAAFDTVQSLLTPADRYYALTMYAREVEDKMAAGYKDKNPKRFLNNNTADELRRVDGSIRHWKQEQYGQGYMNSIDQEIANLIFNVSRCDGWFFDENLAVGEFRTGTDGSTLTFAAAGETVDTPCGTFEDCQLWVTKLFAKYSGYCVNKVWYKSGVGIVKYERSVDGLSDVRLLKKYSILGGSGLLPLACGNIWEYADTYNHDILTSELQITVTHADEDMVMLATRDFAERFRYDETSWLDMIQQIRNEYWIYENGEGKLGDVSVALEKVEALAQTPMEKAHTKAAVSVVRRIIDGETPDSGYTGHWNFFEKLLVREKNGRLTTMHTHRWSFELKNIGGMGEADTPLLYNDIYGILQDAANCIWSDEWQIGAAPTVEYDYYGDTVRTKITCEDGGSIPTKAGTFENCLKLSMDIFGMKDGWEYRGGRTVYYFAEGIGIVRTENEYCDGARTAVYELSSYDGTGDGFMPMADGLVRRYDALDLTDGFVGGVEYTYVTDDDGNIVIFKDATGIRNLPPPITQYGAIQDERMEEQLWEQGKHNESRLRHDVNNFRILCHFLGRDNRNLAAPEKAAEWGKYHIRMVEFLAEGGEIPRAWLGRYWRAHFAAACALFGCGTPETKEEGYCYLERAFELYPKWAEIPDGEALEVGNPLIYGGIRLIKGKGVIELPDGTREPLDYDYLFHPTADHMYYGMTATQGWEWFNPVRGEERFKTYIERAKQLMENRKDL